MIAAAMLLAVEFGLRFIEWAYGGRLPLERLPPALKLAPGSLFGGRSVNSLGYWDDEFEVDPPPGVFRVAVLGGDATFSDSYQTNCLVRLEHSVPGIEVCHFGMPSAGPRHFATQLTLEVAEFQPHLVVAFVSVDDTVGATTPPPGALDWRQLRTVRLAAGWLRLLSPGTDESSAQGKSEMRRCRDYEQYLQNCAQRLVVCRTPIDGPLDARWREALRQLSELQRQCRRRRLPLALVIAPSEFQVDRRLCEVLRRRAGYEPGQLDLELPQRKLAQFANANELPLVDLLPHLRACESSPYLRHAEKWNERGHELAGHVLVGWLQSQFGRSIAAVTQPAAVATRAELGTRSLRR
jgi:hypothetical protein